MIVERAGLRQDRVFKLSGLKTGKPMTCGRSGWIISEIGEKAAIVIDKREEPYVTSRDLRRSFATRWCRESNR